LPALAAELVGARVDVIDAVSPPAIEAAKTGRTGALRVDVMARMICSALDEGSFSVSPVSTRTVENQYLAARLLSTGGRLSEDNLCTAAHVIVSRQYGSEALQRRLIVCEHQCCEACPSSAVHIDDSQTYLGPKLLCDKVER